MTRKDYVALAEVIRQEVARCEGFDTPAERCAAVETVESVANNVAAVLAEENPRFDRLRFLSACGL